MVSALLSCIVGYLIAVYCAGKEMGQKGKMPSLKFKVSDYTVHLHHWLYASFFVAAFPSTMSAHISLFFFFVGIIAQGLTYRDFYKIVYRHATGYS